MRRRTSAWPGDADFGFVLWDGKSAGSVQNMLWLAAGGKKLVVYLAPARNFHSLGAVEDVVDFLAGFNEEVVKEIGRKISLPESLCEQRRQPFLEL